MDGVSIKLLLSICEIIGGVLLTAGSIIALWKNAWLSDKEINQLSGTKVGYNSEIRENHKKNRKYAKWGISLVVAGFVIQTVAKIGLLSA